MNQAPASQAALRCRVLTGPGVGAIAVIRVRGAGAWAVLDHLLERPSRDVATGRLVYGRLIHQGQFIDEAITARRTLPDGTQAVDLNVHGGTRVVQRLLVALQSLGVQMEDPSHPDSSDWPAEHSIDHDAFHAISRATTRRAVTFLLNQRLVLPAHLLDLGELAQKHPQRAMDRLSQLADSSRPGRIMTEGATLAVLGPPNAGKSTLANRLVGRTMSVVADEPGVTRDWVAQTTALDGIPVTLVDTAGIESTPDPDQAQAMQRGMHRWKRADLHLLVLDGANDWPAAFIEYVQGAFDPAHLLVVVNKSDQPQRWDRAKIPPLWRDRACDISATQGDGLVALQAAIVADLLPAQPSLDQPRLFAARQRHCVDQILADAPTEGAQLFQRIDRDLLGRGIGRESR